MSAGDKLTTRDGNVPYPRRRESIQMWRHSLVHLGHQHCIRHSVGLSDERDMNMASCLKTAWRFKKFLIVYLTPLLLLPLLLVVQTKEAKCGYVIILMAVYWCTEVIPLAATSLIPALLLPLFGILDSKRVCMQYLKDTNMLFVGGLMVAVAVEQWNLHKRIALRVLLFVGANPALLMLGFMGVTAFLSMWISNTATTAMMVPIVQAVISQISCSDKETDNTESCNGIHIPGTELQDTNETKSSLEPVTGNGHIPNSPQTHGDETEKKSMFKGMTLCVCYAASIGGTATLTGTGPNLVLKGQMNQLFPKNGDVINFASWFGFAFPNMLLMLILAWFWLQIAFMGINFKKSWGCGVQKTQKEITAYNVIQQEYNKLGAMTFAEINVLLLFVLLVVLWFTRDPGFVAGWATYLFNEDLEYVTDATVAVFVALLLFVVPAEKPKFRCWSQNLFERGGVISGAKEPFCPPTLLDWKVVHHKLPWNIVLLLGGGFALAKGSEVSGLSKWIGDQMTPLQSIPSWAIVIILCLLIAVFTECTSNVATATLFLPVLASMSQSIGMNPLYVMIPCTLSASFAFMLPVATPPNAIVFSYGYLRVSDMAKTGLMMNIIGVLCVTLAINSWGRALFSLDTFPNWANVTSGN